MEKRALVKILKSTNPFRYLDNRALLFILQNGQFKEFADEETILSQGQMGHGLYVVIEGEMNVTIKILGKGVIHLATLSSGNFFGEVSFLENQPCIATISAKGDTLCFLFRKESFDALYLAFPEIRYQITKALIEEVILRQKSMIHSIQTIAKNYLQDKIHLNMYSNESNDCTAVDVSIEELKAFKDAYHLGDFPQNRLKKAIRHKIKYPNNHVIIQHKHRNEPCYYLLKGAVKVGIITSTGFLKFGVIGPERLICSTSMLNNQPGLFVYKTIGSTTVLEILPQNIDPLKLSHPLAWYHFYDILVQHIISLQKRLNGQVLLMESTPQEANHV